MSLGKVVGGFMEKMIYRFLDAGGLVEIGVHLQVSDFVEHFFGAHNEIESAVASAKAADGREGNQDAESFGRWSINTSMQRADVIHFIEPLEEGVLLIGCK